MSLFSFGTLLAAQISAMPEEGGEDQTLFLLWQTNGCGSAIYNAAICIGAQFKCVSGIELSFTIESSKILRCETRESEGKDAFSPSL